MLVDIGEVKRYIKPKADSTLRNMRKDALIEYIRTLEHNYNVAVSFNENQARYIESLEVTPVVHGRWIAVEEEQPADGDVVLVYGKRGGIYTAECYRRGEYYWFHKLNSKNHHCEPTHWMPLPKPPK